MHGYFISFEGGEGAGKSTAIHHLNKELTKRGFKCVVTREPGGVSISENIRNVILSDESKLMDARTEALLYAAARREHLVQKVIPAINEGKIVLCDRFIDSSLAYQGHARGLGIDEVLEINAFAIEGMFPHLTLFFDIEPEIGLRRIDENEARETNRFDEESINFHNRVYEGYRLVNNRFKERIHMLNARLSVDEVIDQALAIILDNID